MTYHPNFSDKRVVERIRIALGFAIGVFTDKPHEWSTRYIDRYFGRQDTELGKWLRSHLLTVDSNRYNKDTGECKSYTLNRVGVRYLKEALSGETKQTMSEWVLVDTERRNASLRDLCEANNDIDVQQLPVAYPSVHDLRTDDLNLVLNWTDQFKEELDSLEFTYEDKSSRLWHPLQNLRKQVKKTVFCNAGFRFQYDIQCCAPTLIHQYAQKLDMDLYLFELREYLRDRKSIRKQVAQETGITEAQAKEIINALFAGAKIGHNKDFAIYEMLNGNHKQIDALKGLGYINDLREDIKSCWEYIKPHQYFDTIIVNGKTRRKPMSSRQKWNIYFDLERTVLGCIREYLNETNNKHFLEHDGWTCVSEIDEQALRAYVLEHCGYEINIDCESLNCDVQQLPVAYPSVHDLHGGHLYTVL